MENEDKKAAYKYMNDYQKNNYDRITILRPKYEKAALNDIALQKGYNSLNAFINECINDKLKRLKININDYIQTPEKETGKDPGDSG